MIVSELQFFEVEREFLWIHAVIFHQSLFGERPEPLDTIDLDFTVDESFPVIDSQMTETVWDEAVITSEFIGVNETFAFYLFDCHCEKCLTSDILNNFYPNFSSALQDPEHGNLPGSSPASVSFSSPAKVGFIPLNLTGEYEWGIGIWTNYWLPEHAEEIIYRGIQENELASGFSHWCNQFEEIDCQAFPCKRYS